MAGLNVASDSSKVEVTVLAVSNRLSFLSSLGSTLCACFLPHSAALVGATDSVHNQTNSFHRQFSRQEELAVASRDIQVKTILRFHFFPH